MFSRNVLKELDLWAKRSYRKPLVLRGARQVGKTTVVNQFSKNFKQYIYLNLELREDRVLFENYSDVKELTRAIFFLKNQPYDIQETLIFIDEIQAVPTAINQLRYFYEKLPELYVIAAGSMLETLFNKDLVFPVGRVEYLVVRPVSFVEYLNALGEKSALEQLNNIPLPGFAYEKLYQLFHQYSLIGGMPEIVSHYAAHRDLVALKTLYEGLLIAYLDDVEKYATSKNQAEVIRQVIRSAFLEAGKRIKFQSFGGSNYGSREIGEALRSLEKALLINLIYPVTSTEPPLLSNRRKSPKLQVLDTGLMVYLAGIQQEVLGIRDLNDVYQGTLIEHLVGQELLANQFSALSELNFWVREKKTSMAEVDFVYPYKGKLIPIEVKSGATGKLRSLHQYMNVASHKMAVRFYSGEIRMDEVKTADSTYQLLSLPYFLVSHLERYLEWFRDEQNNLFDSVKTRT